MRRRFVQRGIGCALVLAASACASPQRLSASIWTHEERARALDAAGAHEAAAGERRDAERERDRLGRSEAVILSLNPW